MKKYIVILGFLFSFKSFADDGLVRVGDAINKTDNVNSALERAGSVLGRFGSVFKKKKKTDDKVVEKEDKENSNNDRNDKKEEVEQKNKDSDSSSDSEQE